MWYRFGDVAANHDCNKKDGVIQRLGDSRVGDVLSVSSSSGVGSLSLLF